MVIACQRGFPHVRGMKHALITLALVALSATAVQAECYADYKAKRDNPYGLHYGVIQVPDGACDVQAAGSVVSGRLQDGWQLLNIVSVFGPEGLDQRRADAGAFFLRY